MFDKKYYQDILSDIMQSGLLKVVRIMTTIHPSIKTSRKLNCFFADFFIATSLVFVRYFSEAVINTRSLLIFL